MSGIHPNDELSTHRVENQPDMSEPHDLWAGDSWLRHWLSVFAGPDDAVENYARRLSQPDLAAAGRTANRHLPELVTFDRSGRRLDEVHFHPAYHAQMRAGVEAGYAAIAHEDAASGHCAHGAMVYLLSQIDPGVCCPLTMTYAGIPALAAAAGPENWIAKLKSRTYDPAIAPVDAKAGATLGMAMTEKQGGSDVRANTTTAIADWQGWRLRGHKFFCSAPMSDGFLTLAQTPKGLTCFLVPRWLPDGTRNPIHLMRLKDKLGNKSNASAEIEYHDAYADLLGEEGNGIRTIITMVHHTRLDTAIAPAGLMRAALAEAAKWARHRTAFQRKLIDQPLMGAVLVDIALDAEGALALGLRIAHAFDMDDPLSRIGVALAKYLSNKLAPNVVYEAMEAMGGMGYVEDTPLPMLFRESPLNSIWEGSGNVIALDILRTLHRDEPSAVALFAELDRASGANSAYDAELNSFRDRWPNGVPEGEARWFADSAATLLTASILVTHAPSEVADAYCATRLGQARGRTAGAVAMGDVAAILARI